MRHRPKPSQRKRNAERRDGCLRRPYKQLRKEGSKRRKGEKTLTTQSSEAEQGEVARPSSVNNAKKQRKTTEWERLEISRKIGAIKGTFHAGMGTMKDRDDKDLAEAEEIKKRWQDMDGPKSVTLTLRVK